MLIKSTTFKVKIFEICKTINVLKTTQKIDIFWKNEGIKIIVEFEIIQITEIDESLKYLK